MEVSRCHIQRKLAKMSRFFFFFTLNLPSKDVNKNQFPAFLWHMPLLALLPGTVALVAVLMFYFQFIKYISIMQVGERTAAAEFC